MELIFVYNAKSGNVNLLMDFAHKTISPSTYACDLCKLTHTNFGQRKEWIAFKNQSSANLAFYHMDEFEEKFNETYEYPVILQKLTDGFEILFDSSQIKKLENVNILIEAIRKHTAFKRNN